ncbi:MAG: DUF4407 domain-containing protein [Flavobacteriales bacterium]|nr:DUF4407 domain-containing protein [Flavobacteriales bacterium]
MNKNFNIIQKLLWSISGVEVWIVEDCPTSYKYYSRQGLLFLMTFLFAAFCGAFAGFDFGGNIAIVVLFGLIWGLLVYAIDQMMIQTIDKVYINGISTRAKFWRYFFPRIFLGSLLALFMSSPLDHYLFREQIEDQMQKNSDKTWMSYQESLKKAIDIEGTQSRQLNFKENRDRLNDAKNQDPETTTFRDAQLDYENEIQNLPSLKKRVQDANLSRNRAWRNIPREFDELTQKEVLIKESREYRNYLDKNDEYRKAKNNYREKEILIAQLDSIIKSERLIYEQSLNDKIRQSDNVIDSLATKIEMDNATIENKTDERQEFLANLQGFDTKFMTLLTHPNFGVQFLRWFIFLVFLLLEILPTWMKLMGKPTEYDIKLNKIREKRVVEFEKISEKDKKIVDIETDSDIEIATEKEEQRKIAELNLHKQTLQSVVNKYENITTSILEDWEDKIKQE